MASKPWMSSTPDTLSSFRVEIKNTPLGIHSETLSPAASRTKTCIFALRGMTPGCRRDRSICREAQHPISGSLNTPPDVSRDSRASSP